MYSPNDPTHVAHRQDNISHLTYEHRKDIDKIMYKPLTFDNLRIDTGGLSVNCSTLGFKGLCNYPHQLKFNFLLILYVF